VESKPNHASDQTLLCGLGAAIPKIRPGLPLFTHGCRSCDRPPIIITSLPKVEAFTDVIGGTNGIARAANTGQIVIECSTLPLAVKRAAHAVMESAGKVLLDYPVSGTGAQAVNKDLSSRHYPQCRSGGGDVLHDAAVAERTKVTLHARHAGE
jgi:hypothetical protein